MSNGVPLPARVLSVLDALPAEAPGARSGSVLDVPHPDAAARARFTRPGPFPIAALQWCRDGLRPADPVLTFTVVEHIGWLAADDEDADPTDVVKQVSFLRAGTGVTPEEFRAHYRHHVEVARRHMPSLWQYVQYDVTGVDGRVPSVVRDASGIVAVSVLWFRSTDDFLNRYFASPEDQAEFQSHEGFLDLSSAFTFVATSHPTAGPLARP